MTDFAVIGAVVLMFLSPPQDVVWPWNRKGENVEAPAPGTNINGGLNSTAPAVSQQTATGPVIPIEYYDEVKDPKLSQGFFISIDDSEFKKSAPADQALLVQARTQFALSRPTEVLNILQGATQSDANVLLLRGAASFANGTPDGYGSAQSLWREAVNGGSKQAQALLGALVVSGLPGTTPNPTEGLRLIEAGLTAGDAQAMRLTAIGYMSGEFGRFDAFKAVELFKRAADAGDAKAAEMFSRTAAEGIAASSPDGKKAELYLRRAAEAGDTSAQGVLGHWLLQQDQKHLIPDPKEAIYWLMRAYERGHDLGSLNDLARFHLNSVDPTWSKPKQGADLVRKCSGFKMGSCLVQTAQSYALGLYGTVNLPFARALYSVASQFNGANSGEGVKWVDPQLSPDEKQLAADLETSILTQLQPAPAAIPLQYKDLAIPPPPVAMLSDQLPEKAPSGPSAQPNDHAITDDLATCNNENANPDAERAACSRIIDLGTATLDQRARAYFERGYINGRAKDLDAALADYSEAIKIASNYAIALNNRGLIYQTKGDFEAALGDYNAAIAADPNLASSYINRSWLRVLQGKFDESVRDASVALRLEPGNSIAMFNRAIANAGLRNFGAAIADYNQLLRLDANNSDYFTGRGWCYFSLGPNTYGQALTDYAQALQINPNNVQAYINRAVLHRARGELRMAMSDVDAAIKINPKFEGIYKFRDELNKQMH